MWAGIVPMALTAGAPLVGPDVPEDVEVPESVRRTLAKFGGRGANGVSLETT